MSNNLLICRNFITTEYKERLSGDATLKTKLYLCNIDGCTHPPFKYKKARDNHRQVHHHESHETVLHRKDKEDCNEEKEDYVYNYSINSLYLNLLIRNINDSIREGDGIRLITSYRMALLYFKAQGHTKYAYTILKLLFRIKHDHPNIAHRLVWCRFINTTGKKGHNISIDLHLEHLNGFLKELLKNLRSNINEKNAERASKTISYLKKLVDNTRNEANLNEVTSSATKPEFKESVIKLATELHRAEVFINKKNGREFPSFPKFDRDVLGRINANDFCSWIQDKKREFEQLYDV